MNSTRNDTIERLEIANSTLRERVRAYEAGDRKKAWREVLDELRAERDAE